MAKKEDIPEQIVEEYLVHKGYFVQHNLKFEERKKESESEVIFDDKECW